MMLPHIAARLYDVPLLIHRSKLDTLLAVLGDRIGLAKGVGNLPIPPPHTAISASSGIAVISVYGTLVKRSMGLEAASGLTSYQSIADQLDAVMSDKSVRGILLDIDSPGGEASGCFDLADTIAAARNTKPIWAIANDSAFSAAYALASAANKVFVTRTGGIGSVGVIALHVDQSLKDAQEGLSYTAITAGAHKNDLSPHSPLTDSARASLQSEVDRLYGLFIDTVARNRGLSAERIRATEAGLFFGQDAVGIGLADGVATLQDVLTQLSETVSPLPVARLAQGFFTPQLSPEETMSNVVNEAPPQPSLNLATDATVVPPTQLNLSDAQEIAELCTLAGCPERIAGYLSMSVANVRQDLLARQAQASTPIASHLSLAGQPSASDGSLLLNLIRQRITNQGAKP